MEPAKIKVYEKVHSHCSQCDYMRNHFSQWEFSQRESSQREGYTPPEVEWLGAEDHIDELIKLGPGHQQAPVWVFDFNDGYGPSIVSGRNPERLTELLNQTQEELWA